MSDEEKTIPCQTCGTPTTMLGTKRCHNCWEVESRLDKYLARGSHRAFDVVRTAMQRRNSIDLKNATRRTR